MSRDLAEPPALPASRRASLRSSGARPVSTFIGLGWRKCSIVYVRCSLSFFVVRLTQFLVFSRHFHVGILTSSWRLPQPLVVRAGPPRQRQGKGDLGSTAPLVQDGRWRPRLQLSASVVSLCSVRDQLVCSNGHFRDLTTMQMHALAQACMQKHACGCAHFF